MNSKLGTESSGYWILRPLQLQTLKTVPVQYSLLDVPSTLTDKSMQVEILKKQPTELELRLPIKFARKQIAAYLGLVPEEDSSCESRRLGHISKQGSGWMRFFLVEAAQVTVRSDAEWRNKFFH